MEHIVQMVRQQDFREEQDFVLDVPARRGNILFQM